MHRIEVTALQRFMIKRDPSRALKRLQLGFSLIEVLVAMVLLSIGMLALAGLQLRSVRATQEAHQLSVASFLAADMADRIRSNPAGRQLGGYDAIDLSAAPDTVPDCQAATCTAAELATFDSVQWLRSATAVLGAARVSVTANSGQFDIVMRWDGDRDGVIAVNCPLQSSADDPGCFDMQMRP